MKFKFNENMILAILGVITFILGLFTIQLLPTLFLLAILVMIAMAFNGKVFNKLVAFVKGEPKKATRGRKGKSANRKKQSKWMRISGLIFLGLAVLGVSCFIILFAFVAVTAPKFDPKELYAREQTVLYDGNGKSFATLGAEKREKVSYNQLPQVLIDAIVATEDSRFFQHNGFDLPRFIKASMGQALGNSSAGGASTLDMQIAKNAFTDTEKSIIRKFTDIYLSVFKIEKQYSKEQIFEFYVNTPFLGSNSYGVQQASRTYFGKSASELTLSEAAVIAGMFQSPSAYNPYVYPERTEKRRNTVLLLMERHGYITKQEREMAAAIPVKDLLSGKPQERVQYQGYIDTVVEEVIEKTGQNPYNVSMKIYTNLDPKKQQYIDDILSGKTYKWDNPNVQAGATVTNIKTGGILAVAAGRNRQGERSFNYATMLKRQPGSTAKPLYDYGPGIEYENWSTYTPWVDEPHAYSDGTKVKNWDSKYMGFLTSRRAIMLSRNIPALKAFQANKNANIVEFVTKLGLHPEVDKNGRIHEAHAIGGYNGESPSSMIGAFGAFGNGGYYIKPYAVNKVEYRDSGKVVDLKSEKVRAMSEATAYMMTDMLVSTVNGGLSSRQRISGIEVAAKTGTTNFDPETKKRYKLPSGAINDLWECSYTPDTGICLWYGYTKISNKTYNRSNDGSKRSALLKTISLGVYEKNGNKFKMPDSVVRLNVIPGSNPAVLATSGGISELFKKGYEPSSKGNAAVPNISDLKGTYISATNSVNLSWTHLPDLATIAETYAEVPGIGDIGYQVYVDTGTGYKDLGFTENNAFSYQLSGTYDTIKFMVKTTFSGSKSITSSGATATVTIGTKPQDEYTCQLNGNSTYSLANGPFTLDKDEGMTVLKNDVEINANVVRTPSSSTINSPTTITYTYTSPNGDQCIKTRTITK